MERKKITAYPSYADAKKFVHKLNLKTQKEWQRYAKSNKRPKHIPGSPEGTYKKIGWKGYGDWLGTGSISNQDRLFLSYNQSKKVVQKIIWNGKSLGSGTDFGDWSKSGNRPKNIPSAPDRTYKKEKTWQSWGDFLGTKRVAFQNKQYLSFEDSRKFVHKLNLKRRKYWEEYCKSGNKPDEISGSPHVTYKKEWKGMGDWLGNGRIANFEKTFRSFKEAREFARELKLNGAEEWQLYCKSGKLPNNIPAAPWHSYEKEWDGYGDWLGTGSISNTVKSKNYLPWPEAKKEYQKLAKKYKLKNLTDWKKFRITHVKEITNLNIPAEPRIVYTKERVWRKMK